MRGLVLTAGGARGAYQAGVLERIGELPALRGAASPFPIVAGASAGAINGAWLAAGSLDFRTATKELAALWSNLGIHDVFRADALSLGWNGVQLVRDLSLGGIFGGGGTRSLLDASPLRELLAKRLDLSGIGRAIEAGALYAVAISATSYHSGRAFTFIQGREGHPLWQRSRRVTLAVPLQLDHVLASAAIPIVFQPVRVETEAGSFYFGDGGLRLVTPFSPAIRLGATHVLGIGIRCPGAAEELSQAETEVAAEGEEGDGDPALPQPPLAQICGVFLNAIFLDHLDSDLDHLERMNELIEAYQRVEKGARAPWRRRTPVPDPEAPEPMRPVVPMVLQPSEDLAVVAKSCEHRMPRVIRHLMDGLGKPDARSADLMSYLLFDSAYTATLVDIGYHDAHARIDEIEAWLALGEDESAGAGSSA